MLAEEPDEERDSAEVVLRIFAVLHGVDPDDLLTATCARSAARHSPRANRPTDWPACRARVA